MKYKFIMLSVVFLIILLIAARHFVSNTNQPLNHEENKIVVSTFTVIDKTWQSTIQSLGNVKASKSISISSEVSGIITSIYFESGQNVTENQVLVNLRADSIKADLEKAQVILQEDFDNYKRKKALLSSHYISIADVSHAKSVVNKDQSDVKRQKALLAQHVITAPFVGILGIRQVQIGEYVSAGQSFVNIEAINPVYVDFSVPEKWLNRIKVGQFVDVRSDAFPGEIFTGTIMATSNAININNRSLEVRVTVPNPYKKLISGMAVNVSVKEPAQDKIIIPQSALAYTPDGVGVYMIDNQQIARWHLVEVGERQHDEVIISSGLKLADTVVVAGQHKLHDGMPVTIENKDLMLG